MNTTEPIMPGRRPVPNGLRPGLSLLIAALAVWGCLLPPAAWAGQTHPITCSYDLLVGGKDVGDIATMRMPQPDNRLRLQTDSTVEVSGWWGGWKMESATWAVHDARGLVQVNHRFTEDEKKWQLAGERKGKTLICRSNRLVGATSQGHDDWQIFIPMNRFETTTARLPAFLFKNLKKKGQKTVWVLDTVELAVRPVSVTNAGEETLTLAGKSFDCKKFRCLSGASYSTIWVAKDRLGAFLVKREGTDRDGPYEIRLKKVTEGK